MCVFLLLWCALFLGCVFRRWDGEVFTLKGGATVREEDTFVSLALCKIEPSFLSFHAQPEFIVVFTTL